MKKIKNYSNGMNPIYKIIFFASILLVTLAIITIAVYGLKFGVDFKGGSVLEISFVNPPAGGRPLTAELTDLIKNIKGVNNISLTPVGNDDMTIRLNEIDENNHQEILKAVSSKFGKIIENRFDSIGPTIGNELKGKSIVAVIVLLIVISTYIALVFRKMAKILSPWVMSVATLIALLHDLIIPIGIFAALGHFYGVEISAVFVAAILTILGYSVSDTVVVFDRVRENVLRYGSTEGFDKLVHRSIMQTLTRSLNTSFTTLLSLVAIYFFGGETIKYFVLALIIGIFLGAYSSIFIASPILVWFSRKKANEPQ